MIFEMVISRIRPCEVDDYFAEHARQHFALSSRHMTVVGAFVSASGQQGRFMLLAAYEDYAQRDESLAAQSADPEWRAFRRGPGAKIVDEYATILNPASFSPLRSMDDIKAANAAQAARAEPSLFELRTYTAVPGRMPTVLKMLAEEGNPLTHQFVEWPVAYFTAETGLANRVMMFWAYASAAERARRKALMLPDPRFQELGSRFNPNFSDQSSEFWTPAPFSPLR